jgi:tetratricopeptide (TPR) repeat protein
MVNPDEFYSQILANGPSAGTIFLVLSKLKEEGWSSKVIQGCIKALEIYPYDIHIRMLLANTYYEAGLLSQAEAELERVTTQIGILVPAYKRQAEIYWKQGRIEEAAAALQVYLSHRSDDQEALELLESILPAAVRSAEGPSEAEEIPIAIEQEALPEIATATLAEIYFDQGQIAEAIKTYEKVMAQNPEDKSAGKRLAELKGMMADGGAEEGEKTDAVRQKKERMIALLESWLIGIQQRSKLSNR